MRSSLRLVLLALTTLVALVLSATAPAAARPVPAIQRVEPTPLGSLGPVDPAAACAALVKTDFSATRDAPFQVVSAVVRPALATAPALCLVNGYVAPTIGFRFWLPLATWNGKLAQSGCGGRCADITNDRCEIVVSRGYACIAADMGHKSSWGDNVWAIDSVPSEIDFGFRSTHVAALASRAMIAAFYGRAPTHAYFFGNSTGGRQGLMEAQRFPKDFDGIISGDAAIAMPGTDQVDATTRLQAVIASLYDGDRPIVTAADLRLVNQAVIAKCDLDDNLADGIISDPQHCAFDPAELACTGDKTIGCLGKAQADAVRAAYAQGAMRGSERQWIGNYIGENGGRGDYAGKQANPYRYPFAWLLNDATNPDLRAFQARGGKLILFHGWSDEATFALNTIAYYQSVERLIGGPAATHEFVRLFVIPGKSHVPINGAAETVDYLSYLETWVEKGQAPQVLLAKHLKTHLIQAGPVASPTEDVAANVDFTRPVYLFPIRARYAGHGDPNAATSFVPVQ